MTLILTTSNPSNNEHHEYGYVEFEPLNISSGKCIPVPLVTVTSMDAKDHNNVMVKHSEPFEVHIQLSRAKLIEMPNDDTFCRGIVKLIN